MSKNKYFDERSVKVLEIFSKEIESQMKNFVNEKDPKKFIEFLSWSLSDIIFFEEEIDEEAVIGILNMYIYSLHVNGFLSKMEKAINSYVDDESLDKKPSKELN